MLSTGYAYAYASYGCTRQICCVVCILSLVVQLYGCTIARLEFVLSLRCHRPSTPSPLISIQHIVHACSRLYPVMSSAAARSTSAIESVLALSR